MKKLFRKKEQLEAFINNYIPPEVDQYLFKKYLKKLIATCLSLDSILPMARSLIPKNQNKNVIT